MRSRIFSSKYIKDNFQRTDMDTGIYSTWISAGISGDWYGETEFME